MMTRKGPRKTKDRKIGKEGEKVRANQWLADPRQGLFLKHYLDPKSETFSNGLQSAIRAGFSEVYAKTLVAHMPKWLSESIEEMDFLKKAESNIKEFLEMDTTGTMVTKKGDVVDFDDPRIMKIKADVSLFVVERIGRRRWGQKIIESLSPSGAQNETHIHFHNDKILKIVAKTEDEIKKEIEKDIKGDD